MRLRFASLTRTHGGALLGVKVNAGQMRPGSRCRPPAFDTAFDGQPPSLSPFGNSIRPQQQFNPYGGGFGGGFPPRNPYGTGGIGGFFSQFAQSSLQNYATGGMIRGQTISAPDVAAATV